MLPVSLEKILLIMRDININPGRFAVIKERFHRNLNNREHDLPYKQIGYFTGWLTSDRVYVSEQGLAELPHLTVIDIQQLYRQVLRQMHTETFVHGNLYKEDALKLGNLIEFEVEKGATSRVIVKSKPKTRRSDPISRVGRCGVPFARGK